MQKKVRLKARKKALKEFKDGTVLELTDDVVRAFITGFNMGWRSKWKQSRQEHAPDKIGGIDEGKKGSASGDDLGDELPES